MLEQSNAARLHSAVSLVSSGQRAEAAVIFRQVLQSEPNNLTALLWLAHTATDQIEIENAIAQAYELAPQNPSVLEAVNWYNTTYFPEEAASASNSTQVQARPVLEADARPPEDNTLHTPVGDPILDHHNFWMTQNGQILTGAMIVLFVNLCLFLNYAVLNVIKWTPFGLRRVYYAGVTLVLIVIAIIVLVVVIRDVMSPPVKAHGFIRDRREVRHQVRDRYGSSTNFYYELYFLSDKDKAEGGHPVRLTLTKEQYTASALTNRAYVEYSKRFGSVNLYQPLRAKY